MRFWLVQRLELQWAPNERPGFDRLFSCSYMGSAEFEFGAVPESLREIRRLGSVGVETIEVTVEDVTREVYFVGPRIVIANPHLGPEFRAWLAKDKYRRSQEPIHFEEHVLGTTRRWNSSAVAWWSLGDHVAWTLDREVAEKLCDGFGHGSKKDRTQEKPKKVNRKMRKKGRTT